RIPVGPAQEQIPLHPLLGVGIRFHPSWRDGAVQQEGERQGQHLRLPGAVVPAQEQATVMEPELFVVVVEQVHQAQSQWLPALAGGAGQYVPVLRAHHGLLLRAVAAHPVLLLVMVGADTAKRRRAGSGSTTAAEPWPVSRTRPKLTNRSIAVATIAFSAPGSWADLRQ